MLFENVAEALVWDVENVVLDLVAPATISPLLHESGLSSRIGRELRRT